MIVSWNWLKEYVDLPPAPDEVTRRLMMAGLNHESTNKVDGDWAIDLEVTSNRPDCLGHVGVAREVSVLFETPLSQPAARPLAAGPAVEDLAQVRIDCPELCCRYTARVIRGVKVGPSPDWLVQRLRTLGLGVVNNVVDITNYVMMECGQPLHAFDYAKLAGGQIIVREAKAGEAFVAIDHRTYTLQPGMCVIADAASPVALGGVMGGAASEVSEATTDVLIEAAQFSPLSIRATARTLGLHSPSSYRFERGVDPEGVDWASRRCCELILELAGGELASGVLDEGAARAARPAVVLRLAQLPRILGMQVSAESALRILEALGCEVLRADTQSLEVRPPSWRRDLTREIDLIEEVARIHGYEKIPEDAAVPLFPSHRTVRSRVGGRVRQVLTAAGFDEAMTASLVPSEWCNAFSPWTDTEALVSQPPMKGVLAEAPKELSAADRVRRSLLPSLLEARRYNESLANPVVELFEMAVVYLPQPEGLPREHWTLGLVSGQDYFFLKGVLERLLAALNDRAELEISAYRHPLFDRHKCVRLGVEGQTLGYVGELSDAGRKQFGLRGECACAELDLNRLTELAHLTPRVVPVSPYPSIARDLNLIVDESVRWADLHSSVRRAAGEELENAAYRETYRDPQKDGPGKKRLIFSVTLRSGDRTLTGDEADAIRDRIVAACADKHGAKLLG